ncbi:MAG TPA: hypothetical protein VFE11_01350, partial [Dongiaceae bacterium]|nr:hypothetical protein [Dongiaceae bacterium]
MIRIASSLLGAAAALVLGAGAASAAPQILGIVASNGALPLACDDQGCRAELSTFCLQQPRANPAVGQEYALADAASVTLIGRNAAGQTLRLPAGPYLRFVSDRGFTSVALALPDAAMKALGLTGLAVEVAKDASLIPVEAPGDRDAQSADEIALATGAHRRQGESFFDDSGESADAIRLTNLMVNQLPHSGRQPTDTDGHVLTAALASDAGGAAVPAGLDLTRSIYATCQTKVDVTHHV